MRIITISREFGSGGRELGKRLSDALHWDYYDKEIITAVAKNIGVAEDYAARALENHGWRNVPLTFRRSFSGTAAIQRAQTALLVEQKRVIGEIAALGKHCIIVGRNADVLLEVQTPANLSSATGTIANMVLLGVAALVSMVAAFFRTARKA